MGPERRDPSTETDRNRRSDPRSGADAAAPDGPGDRATSTRGRDAGDPGAGEWREWDRDDLRRSALAGVGAFLGGYALLYLWFLTQGRTAGAAVDWQWIGWIFYHGQFVPLDVTAGTASAGAAAVSETGLGALANVVPALVLGTTAVAFAGVFRVRARGDLEPTSAARTGATIVVGYLPLAVLGLLVFRGTLPNGVRVGPDALWGVLLTGLVVPILVGALGGLAVAGWRRRSDDPARSLEADAHEADSGEARP